jgi:uncharacterized protein YndB with AHSA1/START domain
MEQAIMKHEAKITHDLPGKKIAVTRAFDAPPEKVWRAFTQRDILDQWWAPKPWKIETKSLDFKPGGSWHFCMVGSNGDRYWWRANILTVDPQHSFTSTGGPCDENANPTGGLPTMQRLTEFTAIPTGTMVSITFKFENEADLKTIAESGMLAGTTMAFDKLDELLEPNAI